MALACDLGVASESATFGLPEIEIGAIPGAGGTSSLPRLIGLSRAKEMVFFGERISADEARRIGLINRVFSNTTFREEIGSYVRTLAQKAPLAIRFSKQAIALSYSMDPVSSRILEIFSGSIVHDTDDRREGMNAFLEKRKPSFKAK